MESTSLKIVPGITRLTITLNNYSEKSLQETGFIYRLCVPAVTVLLSGVRLGL